MDDLANKGAQVNTRWIVVVATLVVASLVGCSSNSSAPDVEDSVVPAEPTADQAVGDAAQETESDAAVSPDEPAEDAATSTDTSETATPVATGWVVTIIDPGAEPRISLGGGVGDGAQALITVLASESIDGAFGDFTQNDTFTGDYDLDITTRSRADGFDLITERVV